MKYKTVFKVLMEYAIELGQVQLSGDIDRIKKVELEHEEYKNLCLKADGMVL